MARTGLSETTLELERRLQILEQELARREVSNVQGSSSAVVKTAGVPQITGLRLINNTVGGLGFRWAPVISRSVDGLELVISTTPDYKPATTHTISLPASESSYVWSGGDQTTTYYIKLRAVRGPIKGPWSSSLNSSTGKAEVNHLVVGAASDAVQIKKVGNSNFTPASLQTNNTGGPYIGDYLELEFQTTGGALILFASVTANFVCTASADNKAAGIILRIIEDGVILEEMVGTIYVVNCFFESTFPFLALLAEPAPGWHVYKFQVEAIEGTLSPTTGIFSQTVPTTSYTGMATITPISVLLNAVELRR